MSYEAWRCKNKTNRNWIHKWTLWSMTIHFTFCMANESYWQSLDLFKMQSSPTSVRLLPITASLSLLARPPFLKLFCLFVNFSPFLLHLLLFVCFTCKVTCSSFWTNFSFKTFVKPPTLPLPLSFLLLLFWFFIKKNVWTSLHKLHLWKQSQRYFHRKPVHLLLLNCNTLFILIASLFLHLSLSSSSSSSVSAMKVDSKFAHSISKLFAHFVFLSSFFHFLIYTSSFFSFSSTFSAM